MSTQQKLGYLRQYDEKDVVWYYALDANTGNKGLLVSPKGSGFLANRSTPEQVQNLAGLIGRTNAYSPLYALPSKVVPTASGVKPYGITLYDVRDRDAWGYPFRYEPHLRDEYEAVVSGQAVPILRRGYISLFVGTGLNTVSGSATAGTYLAASDAGDGEFKITTSSANALGKFEGTIDGAGYALCYINGYAV